MTKFSAMALAATMMAGSAFLQASPGHAAIPISLECSAEGASDISMRARFERRASGRRKFNTEFEAAPGGIYKAGQLMAVFVADFKAGTVRLVTVAGGDVAGELQLDDAADGVGEKPFPPGFPQIVRGTRVLVKIAAQTALACRLQ